MIRTDFNRNHELWGQITQKENETKRRFEYITGQTQADRFFGGQNKPYVDSMLDTCTRWRQTGDKAFGN